MPSIESLCSLVPPSAIAHGPVTRAGDILFQNTGGSYEEHRQKIQKAMQQEVIGKFVPIYQFETSERKDMGEVWQICFGINEGDPAGYMNHLPADELSESKRLISTAMGLTYRSLLGDKRDTGDPTSSHPSAIVKEYASQYKPPAWVLAGLYTHDLVEDKFISLRDLKYLMGNKWGGEIVDFVERLTKVRKSHKEAKNRTETVLKLFGAFFQDPPAIIGKVVDSWHNAKTLYGKPLADRVIIAGYYLQVYHQLAKIAGVYAEGDEIADYCYAAIDEVNNGPEFVKSIRQGIKDNLEPVDIKEMEQMVRKADEWSILSDVRARRTGLFAIAQKLEGRRELESHDFYLNLDIALHKEGKDETKFARRANKFMLDLVYATPQAERRFEFPAGDVLAGLKKAYEKAKQRDVPYYEFRLDYIQKGKRTPVSVKVYRKSEYDLVQTPLTYLDAIALSAEDSERHDPYDKKFLRWRKELAQKRLERIKRDFRRLRRLYGDDEAFVNSILTTLPDAITVIGYKYKRKGEPELKRRPIPRGATVLDYALIATPSHWQKVKEIEVNRELVSDYSRELNEGDVIRLKFGRKGEGFVEVGWFEAVGVNVEKHRSLIADKLLEKLADLEYLEQHGSDKKIKREAKEKKDKLTRAIRHRGWLTINEQVGNSLLDNFGLKYAKEAFPDRQMDARDVAFQVGLGKIDQPLIAKMGEVLRDRWENFTVVVVKVPDKPGQLERLARIFRRHRLDIVYSTTLTKWGGTVRITFRFDKDDPGYKGFQEAWDDLSKLDKKSYEINIFQKDNEYEGWRRNIQNE